MLEEVLDREEVAVRMTESDAGLLNKRPLPAEPSPQALTAPALRYPSEVDRLLRRQLVAASGSGLLVIVSWPVAPLHGLRHLLRVLLGLARQQRCQSTAGKRRTRYTSLRLRRER